jgi:CRISPR-associated protein Cas1
MGKTLYMMRSGELKRKDNTIVIENKEGRHFVPVESCDEILIFGEVSLNKRFLEFATESDLILHFFNHHGYYQGSYYPREHRNAGSVILAQARAYDVLEERLFLARQFVAGGLQNMLQVVAYYRRRAEEEHAEKLADLEKKLEDGLKGVQEVSSVSSLMGVEGNMREQFNRLFDMVISREGFAFVSRSRRPPENRTNALLSFLNTLCYVLALSQIYRTHLDPRIGFLHETNFRRFSLNLDLAEIFKPLLADRLTLSLINRGMVSEKHFSPFGGGLHLNDKGKEIVLREWEERLKSTLDHPGLKRKVSYRGLVRMEAYGVEKHLLGDRSYAPYCSRW